MTEEWLEEESELLGGPEAPARVLDQRMIREPIRLLRSKPRPPLGLRPDDSVEAAWRLMREHRLLQPKRSEGRRRRPGYFQVTRPDELWHLDMTSVWVAEHCWCYLNAAIDCCTREIVGWALDVRCRAQEAMAVIDRALAGSLPEEIARSLVRHRVFERWRVVVGGRVAQMVRLPVDDPEAAAVFDDHVDESFHEAAQTPRLECDIGEIVLGEQAP